MNRSIFLLIFSLTLGQAQIDQFDSFAEQMFQRMKEDFEHFDKQFDQLRSGHHLSTSTFSSITKKFDETSDFCLVILKIQNVKDNPLDISVKDRMITLKGELTVKKEHKTANGSFFSTSSSFIQDSFPVPSACKAEYEVELKENEIVLKFKKDKI